MLVISRKPGERVVIGNGIVVTVLESTGHRVRLGVEAPSEVPVHREEVANRIRAEASASPEPLGDTVPGERHFRWKSRVTN